MPVTYDENVILTFAERLYRRAASMVIAHALFGAMVGALVGLAIGFATRTPELMKGVAVAIGVVGATIGGMIGSDRAFALRLLAQQALCQVQIERNTRGVAPVVASAAPVVSRPPPPPPPSMTRGPR